jgi:hypothetical protein
MSSIFGGAFFIFNGARTFGLTGVGMMLIGSKGPPAVTVSALGFSLKNFHQFSTDYEFYIH